MDDSDQDFVDLCSKLLKRVRKKPAEPRQQKKKVEHQSSSQASEEEKTRRNNTEDDGSGNKCAPALSGTQPGCAEPGSGDAGSSVSAPAESRAKEKVLHRMQQFKRPSKQKMMLHNNCEPTERENYSQPHPAPQKQKNPESYSADLPPVSSDSDEALAFRLQQELDREVAEARVLDLEDEGLFFCQICHRDLSHMSTEGRTQHINRCLDDSEAHPPLPPLPPGVPDCPICGKRFKSQKSRSTHLKRCSSDMGVSPAVLLQALQRQAEETPSVPAANLQTGGTKRKGFPKPGLPARKKPRKKTQALDEDTMVALALSSSLLEQEKEKQRELEAEREIQKQTAASHVSRAPMLMWMPDAGKGRGKRKKGGASRPPPLLLIQDAEAALSRLQERVSALLLRSRAPSPPTPTRCPSTLTGWSGAAPLWQKSALMNEGPSCTSDFYTPELREFIVPWESSSAPNTPSSARIEKPDSTFQPESEQTPVTRPRASILPSSAQMVYSSTPPSTPGTGQLPVSSQVLRDLMELAEDGMTLTQHGYTTSCPIKDIQSNSAHLHLSGFVPEDAKDQNDPCVSGFLLETTHTHSEDTHNRGGNTRNHPEDRERGSHKAVALSRLASDLSSMVNNPQLSDVQLQVDSGDVYFAHSFMVYARCPLLAELVHESGFGVKEDGVSSAQRVLMSDVPGQAVLALLQYLYTAHCSFPASLQPHVLELASRFDIPELQQICQLHQEDAGALGDDTEYTHHGQNLNDQTDQAFLVLLRSMWNDEEQDEEGMDSDEGRDREESENLCDDPTSGDREIPEEQVNEDELVEIYEFAATQRKKEEEEDGMEEEKNNDVDLEIAEDQVFTKLTEQQPSCQSGPNSSLDRSYNRLFSDSWGIYEEEEPSTLPSTSRKSNRPTFQSQSAHKFTSEPSGRTVLQSSASVIDKISSSPPPSTPSMPVPGLSPGGEKPGVATLEVQNDCIQLRDEDLSLKTESQGPRILCIPLSPDHPQENKQPELIVLSDSSEEMEVDCAGLSSRSPSPCAKENTKNYTRIKELKPNEINPKSKGQGGLDSTPTGKLPLSEPGGPGSGGQSPVYCSPEVSWLIPSTPVQPGRSIRTTSTQTNSSIRRTQLFSKGDTSSHSSTLSSSMPDRIQRSTSPLRVSSITDLTHANISRLKPDRTAPSISSLDVSVSNKHSSSQKKSTDSKSDSPVFAVPLCQTEPLQLGNSSDHPSSRDPHHHIPTYCSTPLHTVLHQPPIPLPESPLHSTDPEKLRSTAQETEKTPSTSPEKTVLNSFHLSPLSERSSSSHRAPPGSNKSQCSAEFSSHDNRGNDEDERREGRREDKEGQIQCDQDIETEEAAESSFQQSFMDEPPIAFNDSWGLDVCVDNPVCFSLKLEESRGSSQQDQSLEQRETAKSSSSSLCQPAPFSQQLLSMNSCDGTKKSSLSPTRASDLQSSVEAHVGPSLTPSPADSIAHPAPDINNSLLDSKIWDSWEEDEEEERALPLSQRINPTVQLKTPKSSHNTKRGSLVPITPMPHYSDMDTPELKNKLTRFGVRPLPKRQMILKLKEIHQYTHQLVSSDSEDEEPSVGHTAQMKPPPISSKPSVCRPVSCTQTVPFKEPQALTAASPMKQNRDEEEAEPLSASQSSNTPSTAASEESERSNPELCLLSDGDSDSDGGISASQAATRLQDRLLAVRSFILSNPGLYNQILQYQPLVLSQFQQQLKDAGIRMGVAKLADYLDSQCITFTTAKPGHSAPSRRRPKKTGKGVKAAGDNRARRKRGVTAVH